jgi:membrane protease YdiL (CAAX protease family)
MAQQPFDAPIARPIESEVRPAPTYPRSNLSKKDAIVDILIVGGVLAAFAAYTVFSDLQARLQETIPSGGLYVWVLMNGCLALTAVAAVLRSRRLGPASLGLNRTALAKILLGVIVGVPGCYVLGAMGTASAVLLSRQSFMAVAQDRSAFLSNISDIPLEWVLPVVLFVGLYEEILFRGFLLPRLCVLLPGRVMPIALAAMVFGALHFAQGVPFMVQVSCVAVGLSIVAVVTQSLWSSILTHAVIDGMALLVAIKLLPFMQKVLESTTSAPTTMP